MTGQAAKTVHRLLEFDPKTMKFKRDVDNPIPAQAIVVDEASMLDLFLANSLLKAIALDAQLLLVGDTDQLPSVGPGAVLQDLIASEQIPVVRLTQVFRQAQASHIVSNAHRINQGQFPQLEPSRTRRSPIVFGWERQSQKMVSRGYRTSSPTCCPHWVLIRLAMCRCSAP
jgi:exodeoxyribonuclease V alpha subunit